MHCDIFFPKILLPIYFVLPLSDENISQSESRFCLSCCTNRVISLFFYYSSKVINELNRGKRAQNENAKQILISFPGTGILFVVWTCNNQVLIWGENPLSPQTTFLSNPIQCSGVENFIPCHCFLVLWFFFESTTRAGDLFSWDNWWPPWENSPHQALNYAHTYSVQAPVLPSNSAKHSLIYTSISGNRIWSCGAGSVRPDLP